MSLGEYKVEQQLGSGSYCQVVKARRIDGD